MSADQHSDADTTTRQGTPGPSGSGASTESVAGPRGTHSRALVPISVEERGPRPSTHDTESAQSNLRGPGSPKPRPPANFLFDCKQDDPFTGPYAPSQKLWQGIEIELQPMGEAAAATEVAQRQHWEEQGDEWAPASLPLPRQQAIELQRCFRAADVMSAQANFVRVRVPQPSAKNAPLLVDPMGGGERLDAAIWELAGAASVELLCTSRGLLKKMKQKVFVGDLVSLTSIDWTSNQGMVENVVERRSQLTNPPVANIDQMLLVFSLMQPPWDGQMATRFLVSAEASDLSVTVLLNKADLVTEETREQIKEEVEGWGYKAICLSAESGLGLGELAAALTSKVSVTAGPSGVGKSSLINAVNAKLGTGGGPSAPLLKTGPDSGRESGRVGNATAGGQAEAIRVGGVSQIGRGRHTTRNVTLLPVAGGLLADTPGFNQPALEGVSPDALASYFPEIQDAIPECKFGNCKHMDDAGCAVREGWMRHDWYVELLQELEAAATVAKERAISKKQREGNVKFKSKGGVRSSEVLLDPKKHRNVSRRQRKQSMMELLAEAEEEE